MVTDAQGQTADESKLQRQVSKMSLKDGTKDDESDAEGCELSDTKFNRISADRSVFEYWPNTAEEEPVRPPNWRRRQHGGDAKSSTVHRSESSQAPRKPKKTAAEREAALLSLAQMDGEHRLIPGSFATYVDDIACEQALKKKKSGISRSWGRGALYPPSPHSRIVRTVWMERQRKDPRDLGPTVSPCISCLPLRVQAERQNRRRYVDGESHWDKPVPEKRFRNPPKSFVTSGASEVRSNRPHSGPGGHSRTPSQSNNSSGNPPSLVTSTKSTRTLRSNTMKST